MMKKMSSRNKILLGVVANVFFLIGDYLLGFNTIGTSTDAGNAYGIAVNLAPDWRYAGSAIMGLIGIVFFAIAAAELVKVMEENASLKDSKLFKLFKLANLSGILYFAFIHNCMSMLPVVYNAGFDATGSEELAVGMLVRVGMSIIIPLAVAIIIVDVFSSVSWIGLVITQKIPVKKIFLVCNPLVIAAVGQLIELIPFPFFGLDSGFESLGWLSMYLVSALCLTKPESSH